jgi:hypothetical protein
MSCALLPYLGQLFGDAAENVVVQVPGLRQILHIGRALVFAAPLLSLGQVSTVGLHTYTQTKEDFNVQP